MNTIATKAAAVLAFVIGAMAVVSGGRVILGHIPDYYVIDWVPVYNFTAGLISAAIVAILIWKHHKYALVASLAILGSHSTVMILLQTAYREVVAPDSIRAMTLRISTWIIILVLQLVQARNARSAGEKKIKLQGGTRPTRY